MEWNHSSLHYPSSLISRPLECGLSGLGTLTKVEKFTYKTWDITHNLLYSVIQTDEILISVLLVKSTELSNLKWWKLFQIILWGRKNVFYEQAGFNHWSQGHLETADYHFITSLHMLAGFCGHSILRDHLIRDHLASHLQMLNCHSSYN